MTLPSHPSTASLPLAAPDRIRSEPSHEHAWTTRSRHMTSQGVLLYVRCVVCGAQRVDLQPAGAATPLALSRAVDAARGDRAGRPLSRP